MQVAAASGRAGEGLARTPPPRGRWYHPGPPPPLLGFKDASQPRPSPGVSEPTFLSLRVAGAGTGRGIWKNHPDCIAVGEAAWRSRFPRAASPWGSLDASSLLLSSTQRGNTWRGRGPRQDAWHTRLGGPTAGKRMVRKT